MSCLISLSSSSVSSLTSCVLRHLSAAADFPLRWPTVAEPRLRPAVSFPAC